MGSEEQDIRGRRKDRSFRLVLSLFVTKCSNLVSTIINGGSSSNSNNNIFNDGQGRKLLRAQVCWWLPIVGAIVVVQMIWITIDHYQTILFGLPPEPPESFPPIHEVRVLPTRTSPLVPFYDSKYNYGPYYKGSGKAFTIWKGSNNDGQFPCGPYVTKEGMGSRSSTKDGFIYIKEMKTGSTTLAGVTARIARNVAQRQLLKQQQQQQSRTIMSNNTTNLSCTCRFVHIRARKFANRNQTNSFLWSVVREPTSRLISKFYHFYIGRGLADTQGSKSMFKKYAKADLSTFQKYVRDNEVYDYAYYFKSLSLRQHLNPYRSEMYTTFMDELLDRYNFLGISERMDESLVVLQLLLGLQTTDILYISTKTSGMYDYYPQKQQCIYIQKPNITDEMKEWLYSEEFENYMAPDILVYEAINKSLDLTIDNVIGRERFTKALQQFQYVQQNLVKKQCPTSKITFPCTNDGKHNPVNDCLQQDVACGYKCLDSIRI